MAITAAILGESGDGKTASIIVSPDGKIPLDENQRLDLKNYKGMNPETTVIFNADKKAMAFSPNQLNWPESNILWSSNAKEIIANMKGISEGKTVKTIIIDTINSVMVDLEMLESSKLTYDKWMDLAKDIYRIITVANSLREDLIVYLIGHVGLYTNVDGNESKCLISNGRKLEKIRLESKLPIVLYTNVEIDPGTQINVYKFETQKHRSTGKSPVGMFKDFLIPNSLAFVDNEIRSFYGI